MSLYPVYVLLYPQHYQDVCLSVCMFVNMSRVFVISVVGAKEDKSTNIVMGQIARVAFSLGGKGGD